MMSLSDLLTPMAGEIGLGGVGGFIVGYALKKIAKLVAIAIGIGFLGLQYLAYSGFITINYDSLRTWAQKLLGQAPEVTSILTDIVAHLPFGASFGFGLYLGAKKG